jgi:hypothetical protein
MFDDDEEDFLSEFAIRSKNITSVKNLILRRDCVPKVVNYMTEVIEQMGIPEHIDDFKVHYRISRDTFYIVLDTLIRNGKGPHEPVSPEKQLLVCLSFLASPTSMRETGHIYRVCLSCDTGEVENEYHFFSTCPHYISFRKTFLQKVNIKILNSNISLRHMSLLFNSSLPITLKITVIF